MNPVKQIENTEEIIDFISDNHQEIDKFIAPYKIYDKLGNDDNYMLSFMIKNDMYVLQKFGDIGLLKIENAKVNTSMFIISLSSFGTTKDEILYRQKLISVIHNCYCKAILLNELENLETLKLKLWKNMT